MNKRFNRTGIFRRAHARVLFEASGKVENRAVSQKLGNSRNVIVVFAQIFLCLFNLKPVKVFNNSAAGNFAEELF